MIGLREYMASNLYKSRRWLLKKYVEERLSVQEIMKLTGASSKTIYTWLNKHGIKR